jgi:hypothetical protein
VEEGAVTLKPTTVRFVPDEERSADELAIAALHLYACTTAAGLVRRHARTRRGIRRGIWLAHLVVEAGAEYRGVEVDREIVEHARARYGPVFEQYDGTSIAAPDRAFDLVVAFQMIERSTCCRPPGFHPRPDQPRRGGG